MREIFYSGKFFNELGSYISCQEDQELNYALAIVHEDPYYIYEIQFIWGICMSAECGIESLSFLTDYLEQSAISQFGFETPMIEYVFPQNGLQYIRDQSFTYFLVIMGFLVVSIIFGILGIFVEHTSFGTIKITNEDQRNIQNFDIPILYQGNTSDQFKQIMLIKDELIKNTKKLWARFFLCFSFTRNMRFMFNNFSKTGKGRHKNAMYCVLFLGFAWFVLFSCTQIAIDTYPQNYEQLLNESSNFIYTFNYGGQLYGLNMMYLSLGYIMAINLLKLKQFQVDYDEEERKRKKQRSQQQEEAEEFLDDHQQQKKENNIFELDTIKKSFSNLTLAFREYFKLGLNLLFATSFIIFVIPFFFDGPVYYVSFNNFFWKPCQGGWFYNLLFVQNLLFWSSNYDKETCYPFYGKQQYSDTDNQQYLSNENSNCSYNCGQYLALFSNNIQFTFFALGIFYLYKRFQKFIIFLIILGIIANSSVTFALAYYFDINACIFYDSFYTIYLLQRPWFRFPSYLFGILVAMQIDKIHRQKLDFQIKTKVRIIFYIVGVILGLTCVFVQYFNMQCHISDLDSQYNYGCFTTLVSSLYTSVSPLIFNIAVILIISPALLELESKPRQYLSLKHIFINDVWRSLYKLSFQAYISHYVIAFIYFASTYNSFIITSFAISRVAISTVFLSFFFGFLFYLIVDKPIRNIDTMILFPSKISDSFIQRKQRNMMKQKYQQQKDAKAKESILSNHGMYNSANGGKELFQITEAQEDDSEIIDFDMSFSDLGANVQKQRDSQRISEINQQIRIAQQKKEASSFLSLRPNQSENVSDSFSSTFSRPQMLKSMASQLSESSAGLGDGVSKSADRAQEEEKQQMFEEGNGDLKLFQLQKRARPINYSFGSEQESEYSSRKVSEEDTKK